MARKLNIAGSMKLQDYENFGSNEVRTIPFTHSSVLDNDQLEEIIEIVEGVGGEVRGELLINAQLLSQGRIRVWVDIWLYEGTSEGTDDLDGERHSNFILPKNHTNTRTYMVYNTNEGDDDYVRVRFTCKNLPV